MSIIGCVVNGPGEARETDIGLTGGGKGTHGYLSGMAHHRLSNGDIVEHVVELVEARVAASKPLMRHRLKPKKAYKAHVAFTACAGYADLFQKPWLGIVM